MKKGFPDKHRESQHKKNDDPVHGTEKERGVDGTLHNQAPVVCAFFDLIRMNPFTTSPKTMKPKRAIKTMVTQLVKFHVIMTGSATMFTPLSSFDDVYAIIMNGSTTPKRCDIS